MFSCSASARAYADVGDLGTLGICTPSLQQPSHAATATMVEATAAAAAETNAAVPAPARGKDRAWEEACAARRGRAAIDDRRAATPRDRCWRPAARVTRPSRAANIIERNDLRNEFLN